MMVLLVAFVARAGEGPVSITWHRNAVAVSVALDVVPLNEPSDVIAWAPVQASLPVTAVFWFPARTSNPFHEQKSGTMRRCWHTGLMPHTCPPYACRGNS